MPHTEWQTVFPELQQLEQDARALFERSTSMVRLPAGQRAFCRGDACAQWLLLLEGSVRVQQLAASGREIVISRVTPGKTCIISALSLLADQPYAAEAITESPVAALALPGGVFRRMLSESDRFRQFVFAAYHDEIVSLMTIVGEVAFRRVDSRLAECLLTAESGQNVVNRTHQDLAIELGTAREVISRQLKDFERRGWLETTRGQIRLLDVAALQALAAKQAN